MVLKLNSSVHFYLALRGLAQDGIGVDRDVTLDICPAPRCQSWIYTGELGGCGVTRRHARWGWGGEGRTGDHQRMTSCSGGLAHLAAGGY